ncbi:MAG TPA: DUF3488 and transglutaminase-like domain-containing protein [Pyrinomonadaceae bacterium]|nr:DUF3488 and transglutaminase-like domain-containing protein [Pyrinomonadaceae bacterium]
MNSERLFQLLSYTAVLCGFFSLWISGIFGVVGTALFLGALIGGWVLEGTRWQIGDRMGTALIVLSLPVYYALAQTGLFSDGNPELRLPTILARLIVTLSAIKLLQRKSDRDWIFLYLMAFFEVLLAAGLSISALYFASFIAYVFVMVCTIVLFEIRKTARKHEALQHPDGQPTLQARRIPATAIVLIVFIVVLAAPMFFLLPRVGGAGFGGSGGGVKATSGFSDSVRLGGIGLIQQNNEIVMRVRLDGTQPEELEDIRWRGVALDTFDNQFWKKSQPGTIDRLPKSENDLIQVAPLRSRDSAVLYTVYLEPLDSQVMFVLPRAVGVQGPMGYVVRDEDESLKAPSRGERFSYRILSDTSLPAAAELRRDTELYPESHLNYLQLPEDIDQRIVDLASEVTKGTGNRYDAAVAIETYLQTQFGYTLEQKAGGDQPLADFLFNVREGHCEYFATAMAVMLRTQGVATRVVNGFQRGDYNETADVFVVRQRNAHSWVEVYFPGEDAWVTFDPTPAAGQNLTGGASGLTKQFSDYLDALETYWIQYFVAYDSAEQRSLFTSVRRGVVGYGRQTSSYIDILRAELLAWWRDVRGHGGFDRSVTAIGYGIAFLAAGVILIIAFVWLYRRVVKLTLWSRLRKMLFGRQGASVVEFYERMVAVLASKGLVREPHQTPLEFAYEVGLPEAIGITEKYNQVRFGERHLSKAEADEIDAWLKGISTPVDGK